MNKGEYHLKTLLSFLENKRLFRVAAVIYALSCMAGLVRAAHIDLTVFNNMCLVALCTVYIFVYLVCYFRGTAARGIHEGTYRAVHVLIAVVLSVVLLVAFRTDLNGIRAGNERARAMKQTDGLYFTKADAAGEGTDQVTIRGIVYQSHDYNMYETQLDAPWTFTEEGFITVSGNTTTSVHFDLDPLQVNTVYARTGPDSGALCLRVGALEARYDLKSEAPGETELDMARLSNDFIQVPASPAAQGVFWMIAVSLLFLVLLPLVVRSEHLFRRSA